MRTLFIDDDGHQWSSLSELGQHVGISIPDAAAVDFMMRNMGFICATEKGDTLAVQLWPGRVRSKALASLLYLIHDNACDRVAITELTPQGKNLSIYGADHAIRKLIAICETARGLRHSDFLAQEQDLASLPPEHPLARVLKVWRTFHLPAEESDLARLKVAARHKYVLVHCEPDGRLTIKECGKGRSKPTRHWISQAVGARLQGMPDPAYGDWAAACYRAALRLAEPAWQSVDCILEWPGQGRSRHTYERLILPMRELDGHRSLMVVAVRNPAIDLRAHPSSKVG